MRVLNRTTRSMTVTEAGSESQLSLCVAATGRGNQGAVETVPRPLTLICRRACNALRTLVPLQSMPVDTLSAPVVSA